MLICKTHKRIITENNGNKLLYVGFFLQHAAYINKSNKQNNYRGITTHYTVTRESTLPAFQSQASENNPNENVCVCESMYISG